MLQLAMCIRPLAAAEVDDLHTLATVVKHDILKLQVAMNE
eukprot:CAMPEP_0172887528 /NCGR_PEP_ID=MMETSP1075-20121228/134155_1 /TAXON_ID=2916 /ORGANISM="Ceratium fusus, Strain PA161109" /LENGTH=39 /DNA_ID= /DNA_START= /DNA_END= /DNA_ORIENTATION=